MCLENLKQINKMKFVIIKYIFSLILLIICLNIVSGSKSKNQLTSKLQLKSKSGIGLTSNYKMTLSNLFSKSHKKYENKNIASSHLYSKNTELERLKNSASNLITGNEIFFKGWLKYFKYCDNKNNKKPKQFFKNVMYENNINNKINNLRDKDVKQK